MPGEISLAHNTKFFLDEFTEFNSSGFTATSLPMTCFITTLIIFTVALLRIWVPGKTAQTRDRVAWSTFALGVCSMIAVVFVSLTSESEQHFRSHQTIRMHTRLLFAAAAIAVAGPIIAIIAPRFDKTHP